MSQLFADRFKRARMAAGLKACEIANIMGVSQGYVSQIESGKRQNISKDLLLLAASKMGVTVDWLLSGIGPPSDQKSGVDWAEQLATATKLFHERLEMQGQLIESQREIISAQKATIEAQKQTIEELRLKRTTNLE